MRQPPGCWRLRLCHPICPYYPVLVIRTFFSLEHSSNTLVYSPCNRLWAPLSKLSRHCSRFSTLVGVSVACHCHNLDNFGCQVISPTLVALSHQLRSPYLVTLINFSRPTLLTLVTLLVSLHFTFFFSCIYLPPFSMHIFTLDV